jgi:hypothetical protein
MLAGLQEINQDLTAMALYVAPCSHQTLVKAMVVSAFLWTLSAGLVEVRNNFSPKKHANYTECIKSGLAEQLTELKTCALQAPLTSLINLSVGDVLYSGCWKQMDPAALADSCGSPLWDITTSALNGIRSVSTFFTGCLFSVVVAQNIFTFEPLRPLR